MKLLRRSLITFAATIGILAIFGGPLYNPPMILSGDLIPTVDATFSLGNSTFDGDAQNLRFKNLSTTGLAQVGSLVVNNNFRPAKINVVDADSTITTQTVQAYTTLTAARLISISPARGTTSNPSVFIVKDQSGSASGVNTLTIVTSSGLIDGAASKVCVNSSFGSCRFYCDGSNCFMF